MSKYNEPRFRVGSLIQGTKNHDAAYDFENIRKAEVIYLIPRSQGKQFMKIKIIDFWDKSLIGDELMAETKCFTLIEE